MKVYIVVYEYTREDHTNGQVIEGAYNTMGQALRIAQELRESGTEAFVQTAVVQKALDTKRRWYDK